MARQLPVVIAVALLLTAGCSGLPGSTADPTTDTTRTATQTATATAAQPAELAPGVTTEGVVDPLALADAHADHLQNSSFTFAGSHTTRAANGTVLVDRTETLRFENRGHWRYQFRSADARPAIWTIKRGRLEQYADGESVYLAYARFGGNWTFGTPVDVGGESAAVGRPVTDSRGREAIYQAFAAVETNVTGSYTRDGTTVYRVSGSAQTARYGGRQVTDYAVSALVTEDGVVRRLTVTFDGPVQISDQSATTEGQATLAWTWTDVGDTNVTPPDWYDEAKANTTD